MVECVNVLATERQSGVDMGAESASRWFFNGMRQPFQADVLPSVNSLGGLATDLNGAGVRDCPKKALRSRYWRFAPIPTRLEVMVDFRSPGP